MGMGSPPCSIHLRCQRQLGQPMCGPVTSLQAAGCQGTASFCTVNSLEREVAWKTQHPCCSPDLLKPFGSTRLAMRRQHVRSQKISGTHQALPWVSILVVDIFRPNILGQSIFALSETQREYWYMKYPRMWVSDTHSSHIDLVRGYIAKWGTTSCRDLTGTISIILDIIASARRTRGLVVLTDSGDSFVP